MDNKLTVTIRHKGLLVNKNTLPLAVRVIDSETISIDLSAYKKLVSEPEIV